MEKHSTVAHSVGRLLALPTNVRLDGKKFLLTNDLAYFYFNGDENSFITLPTDGKPNTGKADQHTSWSGANLIKNLLA